MGAIARHPWFVVEPSAAPPDAGIAAEEAESIGVAGFCIRLASPSSSAMSDDGDIPSAPAIAGSALDDGRPRPLSISARYGYDTPARSASSFRLSPISVRTTFTARPKAS